MATDHGVTESDMTEQLTLALHAFHTQTREHLKGLRPLLPSTLVLKSGEASVILWSYYFWDQERDFSER